MPNSVWIISPGSSVDFDVSALGINAEPKKVTAYDLSDIGRYLIHPGPIEVENQLRGCECDLKPAGFGRARQFGRRIFARLGFSGRKADPAKSTFLVRSAVKSPSLKDAQLAGHIEQLRGLLQPFDPLFQEIASLDLNRVVEIRGLCEDEAGQRTVLNLKGTIAAKKQYVLDHLLKPVRMTLTSAHIADGLFEMRGWNSALFDEHRRHRLLHFQVDGKFFACLLNDRGGMAFWINDIRHLHRMLLLQQAIDSSFQLGDIFDRCLTGNVRPLRLMFNSNPDIGYTPDRIPPVYQDIFNTLKLDPEMRRNVIGALNDRQLGVSLSCVTQEGSADPCPVTSISVLHDVRALEPLRSGAPQVVAAIDRCATTSEAGKYYLLEDIQGRRDDR